MATLATCLWLAPEDAPRAVELWTGLVPDSRVVQELTLDNADQPEGRVRLWHLELAGREVRLMAAATAEPPTVAHSVWLVVEDQAELDRVWDGFLAAGGQEMACGWMRDPFGVSWQVLPRAWEELTAGEGPEARARAQRVAEALWQMGRIDEAALRRAAQEPGQEA